MCSNLLEVRDLSVSFLAGESEIEAVKGISFDVKKGEVLGIVGESGSGKSVTARSIMGLLPSPPSYIKSGTIKFNGQNLLELSESKMQSVRGRDIGMIFQDPMSSLNPTMRIGNQITESLRKHAKLSKQDSYKKAIELLNLVGIRNSVERFSQFPHEFSGGMRQRVMIALALACNPSLLIADEPTTALDVTIQSQILAVMKDMQKKLGTSIILITHDLSVVAGMCDRVIVMKQGEIVEEGSVEYIFNEAKHPYTLQLLNALPKLHEKKQKKSNVDKKEPLVEVQHLKKHFDFGKGNIVKAVDDISFSIYPGETLGLVGESGSGKTTTGRTILQLHTPTAGDVIYKGVPLTRLDKKQLKKVRKHIQIIFQDPYSSLNPRQKVIDIIGEALDSYQLVRSKEERNARVEELLTLVGLNKDHLYRYPHEFSGGQRQRISIARALAVEPDFIVCDEPLSALDVSVQKQIVELLKSLQEKFGLTYLFIAHDLAMVKHISDRVAVMYDGKIVEIAESEELYTNPQHPYTQRLLSSIPIPDPVVERERNNSVQLENNQPIDVSNSSLKEVSPDHFVAIS
ncbi:Nickel import system ATP-binding protein NikE OS=Ureibacillus acetophenoni OX=614649 GN=SAMN05877842_112114 PE=3 SV=1 [Ureibacillus acetophenoni]